VGGNCNSELLLWIATTVQVQVQKATIQFLAYKQ